MIVLPPLFYKFLKLCPYELAKKTISLDNSKKQRWHTRLNHVDTIAHVFNLNGERLLWIRKERKHIFGFSNNAPLQW